MRRGGTARRRSDRGAAAVEFAIVVLPLCILLFGIINFGHMLSTRQAVSQAAAEGARAAAVTPGDEDKKKSAAWAAVADALEANGVTGCAANSLAPAGKGECTVTMVDCERPGGETSRCAEMKVVLNYDVLIPGFDIVLPDKLSYTAVAQVS